MRSVRFGLLFAMARVLRIPISVHQSFFELGKKAAKP